MINEHQPAGRTRVLFADSVELFRRGLRDLLVSDGRFAVAAEAARLEDVAVAYKRARPDVALVAATSEGEAMTALFGLAQVDRRARVLLLISDETRVPLLRIIRAGAQGILRRDASPATILTALDDVAKGGAALDQRLAATLFRALAGSIAPESTSAAILPSVVSLLSKREREVLEALALGRRNKQIGADLGVSVGTVKTHLRHIFRKLDVEDRTAAVLVALDAGMRRVA